MSDENMQQTNGYFDQMNEIVDNLADALSKLQLSTSRINLFVYGGEPDADDEVPNAYSGGVPAMVLMNKLIDCVEQAEFVLDELNDAGNFLLGGDDDSDPEHWKWKKALDGYSNSLNRHFKAVGELADKMNIGMHNATENQSSIPVGVAMSGDTKALEAIEKAKEIKAGTIMIGKHVVPAPIKGEPLYKQVCYYPSLSDELLFGSLVWKSEDHHLRNGELAVIGMQIAGLLHKTKEAAIAHAKALIAVSKGE